MKATTRMNFVWCWGRLTVAGMLTLNADFAQRSILMGRWTGETGFKVKFKDRRPNLGDLPRKLNYPQMPPKALST
mgnify:CR=1 FL=1